MKINGLLNTITTILAALPPVLPQDTRPMTRFSRDAEQKLTDLLVEAMDGYLEKNSMKRLFKLS